MDPDYYNQKPIAQQKAEYLSEADRKAAQRAENSAKNILFAFAHGIRLALEVHGKTIDRPEDIMPIIDRMRDILKSPRASLVSCHDDVDYDIFEHMREMEQAMCEEYLEAATNEK